jgi:uncharacterized membrane protein YfcA
MDPGALMTFGIGLYAPSLIMLSLMGLDPKAAFPIMMGACAFLMPVSGLRFMKTDRIDMPVVLGIALGGIPAVLIAAYAVTSMPREVGVANLAAEAVGGLVACAELNAPNGAHRPKSWARRTVVA